MPRILGVPRLGRDLLLFASATAVLAMVLGFVYLASEVRDGGTLPLDRAILVALREPGNAKDALGPEWVEDWMRDITALGSAAVLILVSLAAFGYLLLRRQFRAAGLLAASMCGGICVSTLLKGLFDRPRPDLVAVPAHLSTSFPSGHSMMSAVAYLTLGVILSRFVHPMAHKVYFLTLSAALTVMVGFSRMYLAVHYPTDVLAGWMAGLAWAGLCLVVADWLQGRGAVDPEK